MTLQQVKTIYFDESGWTGAYLSDQDQPYFSYAGVVIEEEEAKDLVEKLIKDYGIEGNELKAARLLKYNRGRNAILELLETLKHNVLITCFHKKYALACKFYEYVFEPCISENNALFYEKNFHRFISTVVYVLIQAQKESAEEVLLLFEDIMRKRKPERLTEMLSLRLKNRSPLIAYSENNIIDQILIFAMLNKETITEELNTFVGDDPSNKWVLDLSSTALHCTLSLFGEKIDCMRVICDASKPLDANIDVFNAMVNRERIYMAGFEKDKDFLCVYNLEKPLEFGDSNICKGLQLADLLAGACSYSFKNKEDSFSQRFLKKIHDYNCLSPRSIFPFANPADLNENPIEVSVNFMVLQELIKRSTEKKSLIDGMRYFYMCAENYVMNQLSDEKQSVLWQPN